MMTPTFFLSTVLLFSLINTLVFALPATDGCKGFRITSPTKPGMKWTSGECYQLSYDVGANTAGSTISVDVYNAKTNTNVSSLASNEPTNDLGAIPQFNLNVPETGNYYFLVTFINGGECAPKKSVTFHVTNDPNSPPADCSQNK
ncbi:hypothetical protein G6F56_011283 [Rhizopus delemar]|nr:hypothetical protein G6F56_011283 [Rhizopus delemar]